MPLQLQTSPLSRQTTHTNWQLETSPFGKLTPGRNQKLSFNPEGTVRCANQAEVKPQKSQTATETSGAVLGQASLNGSIAKQKKTKPVLSIVSPVCGVTFIFLHQAFFLVCAQKHTLFDTTNFPKKPRSFHFKCLSLQCS